MCAILPKFERFILVGDEKQLPAVVVQSENQCKVELPELLDAGFSQLNLSLFERILANCQRNHWDYAFEMLSYQYRTHETVAEFINRYFYHKLVAGSERQKSKNAVFENINPDFLAKNRLIFIESEKEKYVKVNKSEARAVVFLLERIREALGENFGTQSVGVITPYRAQIAEITALLDDDLRSKVTIDTVERYQGSERDIIIISMAVNAEKMMENVQCLNADKTTDKKLNVALSRAREQVILLGNSAVLRKGIFYDKLLDFIECHLTIKDLGIKP